MWKTYSLQQQHHIPPHAGVPLHYQTTGYYQTISDFGFHPVVFPFFLKCHVLKYPPPMKYSSEILQPKPTFLAI